MEKCIHLMENRIYLISAKSVEGLKVFKQQEERQKLLENVDAYLSGICSILHIEIMNDEFHLVIKMNDRERIMQFYSDKHEGKVKESFFIPESSLIFGRQMSNLQVSFVKSYNWKYKRKGVLIDGRYRRFLLESIEEMNQIIEELRSGKYRINYRGRKPSKKGEIRQNGIKDIGEDGCDKGLFFKNLQGSNIDLRGCFDRPFRTSLIPPLLTQKIKNYRIKNPCGPNYN